MYIGIVGISKCWCSCCCLWCAKRVEGATFTALLDLKALLFPFPSDQPKCPFDPSLSTSGLPLRLAQMSFRCPPPNVSSNYSLKEDTSDFASLAHLLQTSHTTHYSYPFCQPCCCDSCISFNHSRQTIVSVNFCIRWKWMTMLQYITCSYNKR